MSRKLNFRRVAVSTFAATAVIGMTTASMTFAQMDNGNQTGRQMEPAAPGQSMAGMDKPMAGGDMAGAMQADQQVKQTLMKIKSADPEKAGDMMFVLNNGMGNAFEVAFSKLVASKTQDDKVKELTQMVEKDHSAANEKLKAIAKKMGVMLPTSLPSEKQQVLDTLSALPPEKLDGAYLMMQRAIHAHDVTMFEDHGKMTKNDELKSYIEEVTPKLKEHAAHINMCAKDNGVGAENTPADAAAKKM